MDIFEPGKNTSVLILGKRGAGKTFTLESILLSSLGYFVRVVFFMCTDDPRDYNVIRHLNSEYLSIEFKKMTDVNLKEFREQTMEIVKKYPSLNGKICCVLDDPLGSYFDTKKTQTELQELLFNGRHYVNLLLSSQSILRLKTDIRANFDHIFIKYFKSNRTLKTIYYSFIDEDRVKDFITKMKEVWQDYRFATLWIDADDNVNTLAINKTLKKTQNGRKLQCEISEFSY